MKGQLQPNTIFTVILILGILLISCADLSAQAEFSGAYKAQVTTQERADSVESQLHTRLYNHLVLQYRPLQSLSIKTAFRRADYLQEEEGSTHIYYAYLQWSPFSDLNVTAGRQYPYNKMIRHAVDGVGVEWNLFSTIQIAGLGGTFAPADRVGFHETPAENQALYASLRFKPTPGNHIRTSYYRRTEEGATSDFLGVDGRVTELLGIRFYTFLKFNLTEQILQESETLLQREFGEALTGSFQFKYRDPNFDLPEWYGQFFVDPYTTLRTSVDYYINTGSSLTAEFFTRMLQDRSIQRYTIGWLAHRWTAGIVHAADGGDGSSEWNLYGSFQHRLGKALLVGAGVNYFDYVFAEEFEPPLNAFGAQIFGRYRLLSSLTVGLRAYYLTNPAYSQDIRLIGELGYQF